MGGGVGDPHGDINKEQKRASGELLILSRVIQSARGTFGKRPWRGIFTPSVITEIMVSIKMRYLVMLEGDRGQRQGEVSPTGVGKGNASPKCWSTTVIYSL